MRNTCQNVHLACLITGAALTIPPLIAATTGTFIDAVFCRQDFGEDDYNYSISADASGSDFDCTPQAMIGTVVAEYIVLTIGGLYFLKKFCSKTHSPSVVTNQENDEENVALTQNASEDYGTIQSEKSKSNAWFGGFGLYTKVSKLFPCLHQEEKQPSITQNHRIN